MTDGFDVSEFIDFADTLTHIAHTAPKKTKKFLQKEGSKLARRTKSRAKAEVGTGHKKPAKYANSKHYVDTIKRSKTFRRPDGSLGISAYSSAPHAHLVEQEHNHFSHGKLTGKIPGKLIFLKEYMAFRDAFISDVESFADETLGEIEE